AHRGRGIGWNAWLVALDRSLCALDYGVVNLFMDEGTTGRAARLPAPGEVHAIDDRGRHRVEIGVREGDQRVLAAKLEQHRLERVGGGLHHGAASRHAAD